jgi:hypothetical protein
MGARTGKLHNPCQRLPRFCCNKIIPPFNARKWYSVFFSIFCRALFLGSDSGCVAAQKERTGQITQSGLRGEQTVAPSSIKAEFKSRGLGPWTYRDAKSQMTRRPGVWSTASSRFRRRLRALSMFASTIGAGRLKAKLATAPAVYLPMPGSFVNSSTLDGNSSLHSATMIFAHLWRFLARL